MLHFVAKAAFGGNPYFQTIFVYKGFNGCPASLGEKARHLNWRKRVLPHSRRAFSMQADQERA